MPDGVVSGCRGGLDMDQDQLWEEDEVEVGVALRQQD